MRRGRDRTFCTDADCQKQRAKINTERFIESIKQAPTCSTINCLGKATRKKSGLCEACYYQVRRTGSTKRKDIKGPAYRYVQSHGYIKLYKPNHPLSDSSGYVFEHRAVLYDHLGEGIHSCFWCDAKLNWEEIVVDHLDDQKDTNTIGNLVPSCNNCNRVRGSMISFMYKLSEDKFQKLFDVFIDSRQAYRIKSQDKITTINGRKRA